MTSEKIAKAIIKKTAIDLGRQALQGKLKGQKLAARMASIIKQDRARKGE